MSRYRTPIGIAALAIWTALLIMFRGGNWQAIMPVTPVMFLAFPWFFRFRRHWAQPLKAFGGIFAYAFLLGMRNAAWDLLWLRTAFALAAGAVLGLVILSEIHYLMVFRPDLNEEPSADS